MIGVLPIPALLAPAPAPAGEALLLLLLLSLLLLLLLSLLLLLLLLLMMVGRVLLAIDTIRRLAESAHEFHHGLNPGVTKALYCRTGRRGGVASGIATEGGRRGTVEALAALEAKGGRGRRRDHCGPVAAICDLLG